MSKRFYVPAKLHPVALLQGRGPEYEGTPLPHFTSYKAAEAYLKQGVQPAVAMDEKGLGPDNTHVVLPKVPHIYTIEVSDEKAKNLLANTRRLLGLGEVSYAPIQSHEVIATECNIEPTLLHPNVQTVFTDFPSPGFIDHKPEREILKSRADDLQRLQDAINRTPKEELIQINIKDAKTLEAYRELFASDGFANKDPQGMDFASRVLQKTERKMANEFNARELAQIGDFHANFNANLEAQPNDIPESARVSIAMSMTISTFASQAPVTEPKVVQAVEETIRGSINEVSAEMTERINDEFPPETMNYMHRCLEKVPTPEKTKFAAHFTQCMHSPQCAGDPKAAAYAAVEAMKAEEQEDIQGTKELEAQMERYDTLQREFEEIGLIEEPIMDDAAKESSAVDEEFAALMDEYNETYPIDGDSLSPSEIEAPTPPMIGDGDGEQAFDDGAR